MSDNKPTLAGRVRTRELQLNLGMEEASDETAEKTEELLTLKADVGGDSADALLELVEKGKEVLDEAQPLVEAEAPTPCSSGLMSQDDTIAYLCELYDDLSQKQTPQSYLYSPYERREKIFFALRKLLNARVTQLVSQGLGREQAIEDTQEFIDILRPILYERGIKVKSVRIRQSERE